MTCPNCGDTGIHACIGRVLPPPTEEEMARFNKVLDEIFKVEVAPVVVPKRTLVVKRLTRECKKLEGLVNKLETDLSR